MPLIPLTAGKAGARTRVLAYGLFGYAAAMVFLGPSVAEFVLEVLGCPGRMGSGESGCMGLAALPANALVPWLSVVPPLETTFLLLQKSWALIAGWFVLIALSLRADRHRGPAGLAWSAATQTGDLACASSPANAALSVERAERSRQKYATYAAQVADKTTGLLALHRRMRAEGELWGSLATVFVLLVVALAAFCLVLGTPFIGGMDAEHILRTSGCSNLSQMGSNPMGGVCGFWLERLEPYQRPWYGVLLSPMWLFTQFSDLLLVWMALILGLVLLFAYRVGWRTPISKASTALMAGGFVVFGLTLLGKLHGTAGVVAPPVPSDGGLVGFVSALPMLFVFGLVFALVLAVGLIALIVFAIYLFRQVKRTPDQAVSDKNSRPD
jgi:hypothetical protein